MIRRGTRKIQKIVHNALFILWFSIIFRSFEVGKLVSAAHTAYSSENFSKHKPLSELILMRLNNGNHPITRYIDVIELIENKRFLTSKLDLSRGINLNLFYSLKICVQFLTLYGTFVEALRARRLLLSALWVSGYGRFFLRKNSLKAGLELGYYAEVRRRCEDPGFLFLRVNKRFLRSILKYINNDYTNDIYSEGNNFPFGAKVCLLGPSMVADPIPKNSEVVVMTNGSLSPGDLTNDYPLVSYFNSRRVKECLADVLASLGDLRLACFKSKADLRLVEREVPGQTNLRVCDTISELLMNDAGANAIQNILYDLITNFGPKEIFVSGVTAFLGDQTYKGGYWTDMDGGARINRIVRWHEPFSNYSVFQKYLMDGQIILGDSVSPHLGLSMACYAEALDSQFVSPIEVKTCD